MKAANACYVATRKLQQHLLLHTRELYTVAGQQLRPHLKTYASMMSMQDEEQEDDEDDGSDQQQQPTEQQV